MSRRKAWRAKRRDTEFAERTRKRKGGGLKTGNYSCGEKSRVRSDCATWQCGGPGRLRVRCHHRPFARLTVKRMTLRAEDFAEEHGEGIVELVYYALF